MPQISVVLPVYNAELRLTPCLDALLTQTIDSMEIIAIDDGSTDSSPAILDRYAESDPRIRVVHQVNGGVWAARLAAIALARGKWLAFCDADDIPHPQLYESLLASAQANNTQMAVCAYRRMDARTGEVMGAEMTAHANLKPCEDPVGFACVNTALWNKVFDMGTVRSSLVVREVPHPEPPRLMEDMVLIASMVNHIDTVSFVDTPLYDYFVHPGSSMRTFSTDDARTVAQWLKLVRADADDDVRAAIDVMAFVHLGVSALDNLIRTASPHQIRDYVTWVRVTLKHAFPRYVARAVSSNPVILRLRASRVMFRMGLLVPAMRILDRIAQRTHHEVKW